MADCYKGSTKSNGTITHMFVQHSRSYTTQKSVHGTASARKLSERAQLPQLCSVPVVDDPCYDSKPVVGSVNAFAAGIKIRRMEAEKMSVMETRRVLGQEHPNTLTSINNLPFTMKVVVLKY
jgi:hypothetical protein